MASATEVNQGLETSMDSSWKDLYRAGSISALIYVLFGMIVPAVLLLTP